MTRRRKTQDELADELADVLALIKGDGLRAATEAVIGVCKDPKAPPQAKSQAAAALYRAGGLFSRDTPDVEKQPHEMTGDELRRRITQLQARVALDSSVEGDDEEEEGEEENLFE